MPLTNAEKQRRARRRRDAKIARYETALYDVRDMLAAPTVVNKTAMRAVVLAALNGDGL